MSRGDHHVLFDLGVRSDWENYAPSVVPLIKATTVIDAGPDVASILDQHDSATHELNVTSGNIQAVIWSHNHFDHIGDISRFPKSTDLVVGPGVRDASWPGWPRRPDSIVLDSDAEGRAVREISFQDTEHGNLKIGRFDAYDYFGDGSFYLLDAPGHAVGHLCALARTEVLRDSTNDRTQLQGGKSTFVFMGADSCHHAGILRPSDYLSLPADGIPRPPWQSGTPCPWDIIQSYLATSNTPFFTVRPGPVFSDITSARDTVRKIQELDALDNILVLLAHDMSIRDKLPLFPHTINAWRSSRLKEDTRWLFCHDFWSDLCSNSAHAP